MAKRIKNQPVGVVYMDGKVTDLSVNGKNLGVVTASPSGSGIASQTVVLTQAQYDALAVKDPTTLYLIVG